MFIRVLMDYQGLRFPKVCRIQLLLVGKYNFEYQGPTPMLKIHNQRQSYERLRPIASIHQVQNTFVRKMLL